MDEEEEQHDGSKIENHAEKHNGKGGKEGKGRFRGEQMKNNMYLKREIHFTVESPDGEQMPMRYKPEMTVETLFHLACKKFHLSSNDHYVVFNNKELEMYDLMKNYTINQNSVVKIYKGSKYSTTPDIFVSVKIRDCRIGSVFKQTDNLWTILNRLLSSNSFEPDLVPIVIYGKSELIGEEVLRQARLRDMGITSGSCIMRFLQLKQEDLDQRKMKDDEETMLTLESLELRAAGPGTDTGLRSVHFKLSEDDLDAENIQFIGERKTLAFRLPDVEMPEELIQEEYFDLLVEEIASLFAEIGKKKNNSNKVELMDNVRAELAKLKEIRMDFDDVIVRIQFPDRSCLQSLYLPEERIGDIKEFVRKFLKEPKEDFDLTYGPNRETANDNVSLAELKMIPVVRFFYEPRDKRFTSVEQYLADDVMLNLVAYNIGKEAGLMMRGESLERFLMNEGERDGSIRKSTGGFLSKFMRSSQSSSRLPSTRGAEGSRSKSMWAKKQSSFQPRSWSHTSSMVDDGEDDDDETPKMSLARPSVYKKMDPSTESKIDEEED